MRLRRKPWVDEAIHEYDDFVYPKDCPAGESEKGRWQEIFGRKAPLFVELGTGKGDFISRMAELHPEANFIGIEVQQDVLIAAARKVREKGLENVRLLVFDIAGLRTIFSPGEISRFYVNFCDPWPKKRHGERFSPEAPREAPPYAPEFSCVLWGASLRRRQAPLQDGQSAALRLFA